MNRAQKPHQGGRGFAGRDTGNNITAFINGANMCDHSTVKCLLCGEEGSPAQLLARRSRTVTPAMAEQRKKAAAVSAAKRRKTATTPTE